VTTENPHDIRDQKEALSNFENQEVSLRYYPKGSYGPFFSVSSSFSSIVEYPYDFRDRKEA